MNKVEILGTRETIYIEHLDNGLDIYMQPNDKVKNFYITLNVKYGSIYTNYKYNGEKHEDPKGIAHYLEHLMFNMPDEDAFEHFATLGSSVNAYTSNDVTCYEVFANSHFKENLSYLINMVYTPYFNKELVSKERGIITEEIKMYEDDPSTNLFRNLYENIFINDERRYLVSGSVDDIKQIKSDDISNAYKAFYKPEKMFLIITGNFNPEEAVAITSSVMNNFGFAEEDAPELLKNNEPFEINNEYISKEMDVKKSKVALAYKIPKNNFKTLKLSRLELKLYLDIISKINFGTTSIINEELKSNGIINKYIGSRLEETDDYFIQIFIAETDYPDYFINRIKDTMSKLSASDEDISRKIKVATSNLIWLFDNIESINTSIQDDILNYGTVINDINVIYKSLSSETAEKIIEKLENNLLTISVVKPQN